MKTLTHLTFVVTIIVFTACKKDNSNNGITGKWRLTAYLADPGNGKGQWTPVQNDTYDYVKFHSNGVVEGTVFTDYVSYELNGSDIVVFATKDNTIQNYSYNIEGNTMIMSPAGPIRCTEACGIKFARVTLGVKD